MPDAVARDSAEHTWPAYRDALSTLLEDNPLPDAIDKPRRPTLIILGQNDTQAPPEDVLAHPHEHIRVEVWPSDHLLPLRHADRLANLLQAELLSPSPSLKDGFVDLEQRGRAARCEMRVSSVRRSTRHADARRRGRAAQQGRRGRYQSKEAHGLSLRIVKGA